MVPKQNNVLVVGERVIDLSNLIGTRPFYVEVTMQFSAKLPQSENDTKWCFLGNTFFCNSLKRTLGNRYARY